jgi:large subunit ribosomal protein L25
MPEIVVAAQSRTETGKNHNRRLRSRGLIPAVLYGPGQKAQALAVSPKDLAAILRSGHGENTLFDLEVGGARRKVILKDYHAQPVDNRLLHADFYEVALDKPLELTVHVELQGTPVGVKTQGGVLDFVTRELEIECLPADIPEKILLDIAHLELGKHLRVSDIQAPRGVTILSEPELVVAHVVHPRAEVVPEAAAAPAEGAVAEPEVMKKGKGEAEGEAKPEKAEKADKAEAEKPEKKEKKEKEKKEKK